MDAKPIVDVQHSHHLASKAAEENGGESSLSSPVSATIHILSDEEVNVTEFLELRISVGDEGHSQNALNSQTESVNGVSQVSPSSAVISIEDDLSLHAHQLDEAIQEEEEDDSQGQLQLPQIQTAQTQQTHDVKERKEDKTPKSSNQIDKINTPKPLREPFQLPWGTKRSRTEITSENQLPGALVLCKLFQDFTKMADKKVDLVLSEPLERPLQKSLQRGEDAQLDQLLCTLSAVSEHCLPALLRTLFTWYELQMAPSSQRQKSKSNKDVLSERRDLAVDFIFCHVLIECLKQLSFHPGYDDLVDKVLQMAFSRFKVSDSSYSAQNTQNVNTLADLYAEVLGTLAKSRFLAVKRRFLAEIKELRPKEATPAVTQQIISLIMGLKFFRVKMFPIEEFEECVQFLHDLAAIFLDTKDKDIKQSLAGLFVEIILPMAAIVRTEVNVPVLRTFVEKTYPAAIDLATKRRHSLALYPMVTCLLCVSQKTFFVQNWSNFVSLCLAHLRGKDTKMCRVALESLYRLIWVYMIRIKGESNAVTNQRLLLIINSLFPKSQKGVVPKDMPLNIYVKIIQFIARERLDFAMTEIIYDLLSVGKKMPSIIIQPERMSIGLRAFLVIADNLHQKDTDPPMPQTVGILPSGSTLRVKKTFLNKMLTDESAKNIGLHAYYPQVRKALSVILRQLDGQIGKTLMMTKPENKDKDMDDLITVDKKSKMDLLRTCVAAVPRLMPASEMTISELVEMLLRFTVHVDEELRGLAYQALQGIMTNYEGNRDTVLAMFVTFIQTDILDTFPQLVDGALRMMQSLLSHWKSQLISSNNSYKTLGNTKQTAVKGKVDASIVQKHALHQVEALGLVMLCSCRQSTRKLAFHLLKESAHLLKEIQPEHTAAITCIDSALPQILEAILPSLPQQERLQVIVAAGGTLDLQWLVDQQSKVWYSSYRDESLNRILASSSNLMNVYVWSEVLAGIMSYDFVKSKFPSVVNIAWPIAYSRLIALFPLVDPNTIVNEQRSSGILRASKKPLDDRDMYISLWRSYSVFCCCIAPSSLPNHQVGDMSLPSDGLTDTKSQQSSSGNTARDLFKVLIPLMKCEVEELRESAIKALGRCSPEAILDLSEEVLPTVKEAMDRKQENVRRRKKKDQIRLSVSMLFHLLSSNKILAHRCANVIDPRKHALRSSYMDYIEGARAFLESEADKDIPMLQEVRLHFSCFITDLINNAPVEHREKLLTTELRFSLFNLLSSWSKSLGHMLTINNYGPEKSLGFSELELASLKGMAAMLNCGKIFDPSGISESDGYIYPWLDRLLSCPDANVNKVAQDILTHLFRYNADTQYLLDWTVDRCYVGVSHVADACFTTLVHVFCHRDYPCDSIAMLNVALLYCGCPRIQIREMASRLLLNLCQRFLMAENLVLTHEPSQVTSNESSDIGVVPAYHHAQYMLSEQLARMHPDLTVQVFSEVCQRLDKAIPSLKQSMLLYLSPWLLNVELVNPDVSAGGFLLPYSTDPMSIPSEKTVDQQSKSLLRGNGWGSLQATQMVLNNLMYITVKAGDDIPQAVENLWQVLCSAFPLNLRCCIRYIHLVSGISPQKLLPFGKRVLVYIARKHSRAVLDELVIELQSVETLPFNVERILTAPYFKLVPLKQSQSVLNKSDYVREKTTSESTELQSKEPILKKPTELMQRGDGDPPLQKASVAPGASALNDFTTPYPLPMPAFGGYFAPLNQYIPDSQLLINSLQRCFLSLSLMTDLLCDDLAIDWMMHIPILLHVSVLGCDHSKALVYEHSKKMLLSLFLLCIADKSSHDVSIVLEACTSLQNLVYSTSPKSISLSSNTHSLYQTAEGTPLKEAQSSLSINNIHVTAELASESCTENLPKANAATNTQVQAAVQCVIDHMKIREGLPLWNYETVTVKQRELKSFLDIQLFIGRLLIIFNHYLPQGLIDLRWYQTSLTYSMSCPSRHYAGRSLQVFRAIGIPMSIHQLTEVTSRLVEVVSESAEEMQGFVIEIVQTLFAAVKTLNIEILGPENTKDLFFSTPNLDLIEKSGAVPAGVVKKSITSTFNQPPSTRSHKRSTSVSLSTVTKRTGALTHQPSGKVKHLSSVVTSCNSVKGSGDADTTETEDGKHTQVDEKLSTLVQLFWLGASLLESDYEYEFLLAVNLLKQILYYLKPDRIECKEKLEKTLNQLKWPRFPGLQSLVVKGLTCSGTIMDTWALLSYLTLCIKSPVISADETLGFPLNVMYLLPFMVQFYEEPTATCREAADNIAEMAREISNKLENLATVMRLYSKGAFGKDGHQWTKCVVKYLMDVYNTSHLIAITLLLEVLEQCPASTQASVLLIINCVLHYVDVSSLPSSALAADLITTVSKFVEGPHWSEAQKILKLAVKTSSSILPVYNKLNENGIDAVKGLASLQMHTSFAETKLLIKKELPGKTLDFTFDLSSTPIIGQQYMLPGGDQSAVAKSSANPKKDAPLSSSSVSSADIAVNWRRPHHSQHRVRERLICLLHSLGQRVGLIKSPSVIFSQQSEPVDRQMSICSSSEETISLTDPGEKVSDEVSTSDQFGEQYFKDFDFLDNEEDTSKDEIQDYFNMGLKRQRSFSDIDYTDASIRDSLPVSQDRESTITVDEASTMSIDGDHNDKHAALPLEEIPSVKENIDILVNSEDTESTASVNSDLPYLAQSINRSGVQSYLGASSEEVEEFWNSHINMYINNAASALTLSNLFPLFSRLFQETKRKLRTVTKESCFYLSKAPALKELSSLVITTLEVLAVELEVPFIYVDPDNSSIQKATEVLKFAIMEVHEAFVDYMDRLKTAQQVLDSVKLSLKVHNSGSMISSLPSDGQKSELSMCLFRLLFHLMTIFNEYIKLSDVLKTVIQPEPGNDFSKQVSELKLDIKSAAEKLAYDTQPGTDLMETTQQEALASLVKQLSTKLDLVEGLRYLRLARQKWPGETFGADVSDDIPACLYNYCRFNSELFSGLVVITDVKADTVVDCRKKLTELRHLINKTFASVHDIKDTHAGRQQNDSQNAQHLSIELPASHISGKTAGSISSSKASSPIINDSSEKHSIQYEKEDTVL